MSDFHLVDPQGWEYDLQSVYSAYMGHFQLHGVPWHERTWGQFFETFEQFLAFSWPVITVTDTRTGRAHIVTRMSSIVAFLKMIKQRFGEKMPQVDNMLLITPFETTQRHLRHVNDGLAYRKLHASLPAVALAALKARVRGGDPTAIRELWASRDKTFLAIDFKSHDRSERSCIEWGYAAIRSSHLVAAGAWPPVPDTNYRKGHYIISEYADAFHKPSSAVSWQVDNGQYAFGESQVIPKAKMPRIIQSILSLVTPDSETVANNVVLVGHGLQVMMQRLEEMKIKLPTNTLTLDIAHLERALFATGERGPMHDRQTGRARAPESLLSLAALLRSFGIAPPCVLQNAGNDAFMTLVVFQRMVDSKGGVMVPKGVGAGVVGPGVGVGLGMRNGHGNGNGNGNGTVKGHGHGHEEGNVKRATTVAARLFRPLGGGNVPGEAGTKNTNTRNGHHPPSSYMMRHGADEMGVRKRTSMFSGLRSPSLASTDDDKHKRPPSRGSTSGSVSGSVLGVAWLNLSPGQNRRHSTTVEKRRSQG